MDRKTDNCLHDGKGGKDRAALVNERKVPFNWEEQNSFHLYIGHQLDEDVENSQRDRMDFQERQKACVLNSFGTVMELICYQRYIFTQHTKTSQQ